MNFYIYQSVSINCIRINAISNSSVLQIGSAGSIRTLSQLFNTGGFTAPAPSLAAEEASKAVTFVRLPNPS